MVVYLVFGVFILQNKTYSLKPLYLVLPTALLVVIRPIFF